MPRGRAFDWERKLAIYLISRPGNLQKAEFQRQGESLTALLIEIGF
jgi:hypothetical protein